jgi:arylsulfatase
MGLYNLSIDPGEDRNVIEQYPEKVKELNTIADKYRHEMGDGLTNIVGTEVRPPASIN